MTYLNVETHCTCNVTTVTSRVPARAKERVSGTVQIQCGAIVNLSVLLSCVGRGMFLMLLLPTNVVSLYDVLYIFKFFVAPFSEISESNFIVICHWIFIGRRNSCFV